MIEKCKVIPKPQIVTQGESGDKAPVKKYRDAKTPDLMLTDGY